MKERPTDTAVVMVDQEIDGSWSWHVRWRNTRIARATRTWTRRADTVTAAERAMKVMRKAILIVESPGQTQPDSG